VPRPERAGAERNIGMRLCKYGLVPLYAAIVLAALTGLNLSSGAATRTVTASIKFVTPGVVNKSSNINFPPLPETNSADAFLFMDSYGMTWAQQGDVLQGRQGSVGAITIDDNGSQLINFLTSNMDLDPGLEPLRIFCSMHATTNESCRRLMMPDAKRKKKTVYIAMNILVDKHGNAGNAAGYPSSIDIAIVYQ
jgi:hypothetical protein